MYELELKNVVENHYADPAFRLLFIRNLIIWESILIYWKMVSILYQLKLLLKISRDGNSVFVEAKVHFQQYETPPHAVLPIRQRLVNCFYG